MTTDTRTPAEVAYDAQRDGSAYIRTVLHTPIDPIVYRAGFVTGRLTRLLTNELEPAHAERLLTLLEAMINPAPIAVVPHICDDELDERFGQQIWTDYIAGGIEFTLTERDALAYGAWAGELSIDYIEQELPNLLALLASPVVQAAREVRDGRH